MPIRLRCAWMVCLVALSLSGCSKSDPAAFRLNAVELAKAGASPQQKQDIANALEALFGTPDDPFVLPETGLDLQKLRVAAGSVWSDQGGTEHGLYRQHCVHCHGVSGDGMGPTAEILNPYPRDYRYGKYKFKTTLRVEPPSDEDLRRIIRNGIPDTAMPAFVVALSDGQIDALTEYVKYLSIRGQVELDLINLIPDLGEGESLTLDRETLVNGILKNRVEQWQQAKDKLIEVVAKPDADATLSEADRVALHQESIKKGQALFYKSECTKCHGNSALGDGQTSGYDDWNDPLAKMQKDIADARETLSHDDRISGKERGERMTELAKQEQVLHWALPVRNIIPRNLRRGVFRGGNRPVDLYCRISEGINGTTMPAANLLTEEEKQKLSADEQKKLTGERLWNLVDYVRSLAYEPINNPYVHETQSSAALGQRSH